MITRTHGLALGRHAVWLYPIFSFNPWKGRGIPGEATVRVAKLGQGLGAGLADSGVPLLSTPGLRGSRLALGL